MASLLNIANILSPSRKADDTLNSGGKVYVFQVGTSTPLPTYTDSTLGTQNPHPVVLNSSGYADIWINADADIQVKDANDVVIRTATKINPTQASGTSLLNSNNSWTGTNAFTAETTVPNATKTGSALSVGELQSGGYNYVITTGTSPTYVATLPLLPLDTTFTSGAILHVTFHQAQVAGLATLNVNGTGALPLFYNGAQLNTNLVITAGAAEVWQVVFDSSTGGRWHLVGAMPTANNTLTGNNTLSGENAFTKAASTGVKPAIALGPGSVNPGWSTDFHLQQIGPQTYIARQIGNGTVWIANNAWYDNTNWRAIGSGKGELIGIIGGTAGPYDTKVYNLDNGSGGTVAAGAIFTLTDMGSLARIEASGSVNTLVRRNSLGHIFNTFFNMTADDIGTATPSRVPVETGTDGFLRWQTLANFKDRISGDVVFTSNGTFVVPAGVTTIKVLIAGGGGGGGGGDSVSGRGGGGGRIRILYSSIAVTPGSSHAVTIGAGGAGGAAASNGAAGATTSLGALISVAGGTGGVTANADENTNDNDGESCDFGTGGDGGTSSVAGANGTGRASGGGGGGRLDAVGGAGAGGFIHIWW